ncbi:hypothetical protein NK983_26290, partial [Salmonella enterica subsp. enterica serovar Typhimurium]|nr:hypothetical protein [Salmonella enterica subsp. enterica serovar Typhimurium]
IRAAARLRYASRQTGKDCGSIVFPGRDTHAGGAGDDRSESVESGATPQIPSRSGPRSRSAGTIEQTR